MSSEATRYEPCANDPRIIAVLEARARVDAAMTSGATKTTPPAGWAGHFGNKEIEAFLLDAARTKGA